MNTNEVKVKHPKDGAASSLEGDLVICDKCGSNDRVKLNERVRKALIETGLKVFHMCENCRGLVAVVVDKSNHVKTAKH